VRVSICMLLLLYFHWCRRMLFSINGLES
jgi:hypothetical protein